MPLERPLGNVWGHFRSSQPTGGGTARAQQAAVRAAAPGQQARGSPRQGPSCPRQQRCWGQGESSANSTAPTAFSSLIQDTEGNQALGFSDGGGCLQKSSVSTFYELQRGNRIGCLLVSGQKLVSGTCVRGGSGELDIVVGTELGLEHAAWALALHAPAACRWECRSPRGGNKHPQLFSALTAFIL